MSNPETNHSREILQTAKKSEIRRYFIQKYPGSSAERGLRPGSLKGPLLWLMLGETAITKHNAVLKHADDYSTLVETGTFNGDLIAACHGSFKKIVSIELSDELHEKAKQRFSDQDNVELLHGDSGVLLKVVVQRLAEPALFWLDAHYSHAGDAMGETITPAATELLTILSSPLPHRILIDDARSFQTLSEYPSVDELRSITHEYKPRALLTVQDDIISIEQPL